MELGDNPAGTYKRPAGGFFLTPTRLFFMKFDGKKFEMRVNHKDDVMTGMLYERRRFLDDGRIIIARIRKNL